jgi:predicted nucleic acid-binding protein
VSPVLLLDSGPLGLLTHPQHSPLVISLTDWLTRTLQKGVRVLVPAVIYYELKRELLRAGKSTSLRRLDAFVDAAPDRYLPLSDSALRMAAELWASARRAGRPTSPPEALDIDVLLAAQALALGREVLVVTLNRKHLELFVPAAHWNDIPA